MSNLGTSISVRTPELALKFLNHWKNFIKTNDSKELNFAIETLWEISEKIENFNIPDYETEFYYISGWISPSFCNFFKQQVKERYSLDQNSKLFFNTRREDVENTFGPLFKNTGYELLLKKNLKDIDLSFTLPGGNILIPSPSTNSLENDLDRFGIDFFRKSDLFNAYNQNFYIDEFRFLGRDLLFLGESTDGKLVIDFSGLSYLLSNNPEELIAALRYSKIDPIIRYLASETSFKYHNKIRLLSGSLKVSKTDLDSKILKVITLFKPDNQPSHNFFPIFNYKHLGYGVSEKGSRNFFSDDHTVHKLSNVNVMKGGTVFDNENLYQFDRAADSRLDEVSGQWDHLFGAPVVGSNVLLFGLKDRKKISIRTGILIAGRNDSNWYHFLIEYLPTLIHFDKSNIPSDCPVIISDRVSITAVQALKLITKRNIITISADQITNFETLYVVSPNASIMDTTLTSWDNLIRFDYQNMLHFRSLILSKVTNQIFPSKIYLDRKSKHRSLKNNKTIKFLCRTFGYKAIDVSTLTFDQQVNLFANAKSVVTQGGAVMANYIFMSNNAKIVQLNNAANKHFILPAILCQVSGAKMYSIVGRRRLFGKLPSKHIYRIHASYHINPLKILWWLFLNSR